MLAKSVYPSSTREVAYAVVSNTVSTLVGTCCTCHESASARGGSILVNVLNPASSWAQTVVTSVNPASRQYIG